jgi:hypothetical protein
VENAVIGKAADACWDIVPPVQKRQHVSKQSKKQQSGDRNHVSTDVSTLSSMRQCQHSMQQMPKLLTIHRKIKHGAGVLNLKTRVTCATCIDNKCKLRADCPDNELEQQKELLH